MSEHHTASTHGPVRIIGTPPEERNSRRDWNRRYASGRGPQKEDPHPWLVENLWRVKRGRALDVACGMGRDSIWLAQQGFRVHGVDFSAVALRAARERAARLGVLDRVQFVVADLTQFGFPRDYYDLVIGFSFWEPRIMGDLRDAVRPGGFLIYETFNIWWKWTRPDVPDRFLLQPGELRQWFKDWRVWAYREVGSDRPFTAGKKAVSSIVAQKPEA